MDAQLFNIFKREKRKEKKENTMLLLFVSNTANFLMGYLHYWKCKVLNCIKLLAIAKKKEKS